MSVGTARHMMDLIDQAARNPEFIRSFLSPDQWHAVFGASESPRRDIAEILRPRIAHSRTK